MKENKLIAFIVTIGIVFLAALVFMDCWNWFVVPTFGVSIITFWYAMGVRFTYAVLTMHIPSREYSLEDLGQFAMMYLVAWGFGWLIHLAV